MSKKWTNKLYVRATTADGSELVSPILSITPTFSTPHVWEDSLDKDNVNVSRGNFKYNFNMVVRALRDLVSGENPAKTIALIQQKGLEFEIFIGEQKQNDNEGKQWFLDKMVLSKAYVNNLVSTNTQGASPQVTYACSCGEINLDGEVFNGSNPTPIQ